MAKVKVKNFEFVAYQGVIDVATKVVITAADQDLAYSKAKELFPSAIIPTKKEYADQVKAAEKVVKTCKKLLAKKAPKAIVA